MKLKVVAVVLAAMMMCVGCADTGGSEKNAPTSAKQSAVSTVSMPDPVPVPEGGWTDETLKDVIYINGKNLDLPCTVDDLGDGFEIEPDKESDEKLKEKGSATYLLDYCGYCVGIVGMKEPDKIYLIDFNIFDKSIEYLMKDYPPIPFSINGFTLGTPYSEVQEIMGEEFSDKGDRGYISFQPEDYWITVSDDDGRVSKIKILLRNKDK